MCLQSTLPPYVRGMERLLDYQKRAIIPYTCIYLLIYIVSNA